MKIKIMLLTILLGISGTANADLFLDDYLVTKRLNEPRLTEGIDLYIKGIGEGLFWGNAMTRDKHNTGYYCAEMDLKLDLSDYRSILDTEIEKHKEFYLEENSAIALILLVGLQNKFPCK